MKVEVQPQATFEKQLHHPEGTFLVEMEDLLLKHCTTESYEIENIDLLVFCPFYNFNCKVCRCFWAAICLKLTYNLMCVQWKLLKETRNGYFEFTQSNTICFLNFRTILTI